MNVDQCVFEIDMYTTSVVCLVSGMWGSMVCVLEVGGMWSVEGMGMWG